MAQTSNPLHIDATQAERYRTAIIEALRAYMQQHGFTKVVVGCSGGIDSALTIALAAQAIGAENVMAITMPSTFSTAGSVRDSEALCLGLGTPLLNCPIHTIVDQFSERMRENIGQKPVGLALENLQARARGVILMTYSNLSGHLVLSTGNKSETSVGYCTLYGDTCGGLNLIGELYKTEVYALARHLNAQAGIALIPAQILEKAPSAELAPGQKDSDSLPDYDVLDCALLSLQGGATQAAKALGYLDAILGESGTDALMQRTERLIARSQFKRMQLPPTVRLREKDAGRRIDPNVRLQAS